MTNSNGNAGKQNGPGSARSAFAPGELVAARYKIVRLIGSGGTGEKMARGTSIDRMKRYGIKRPQVD